MISTLDSQGSGQLAIAVKTEDNREAMYDKGFGHGTSTYWLEDFEAALPSCCAPPVCVLEERPDAQSTSRRPLAACSSGGTLRADGKDSQRFTRHLSPVTCL